MNPEDEEATGMHYPGEGRTYGPGGRTYGPLSPPPEEPEE